MHTLSRMQAGKLESWNAAPGGTHLGFLHSHSQPYVALAHLVWAYL